MPGEEAAGVEEARRRRDDAVAMVLEDAELLTLIMVQSAISPPPSQPQLPGVSSAWRQACRDAQAHHGAETVANRVMHDIVRALESSSLKEKGASCYQCEEL